MMYRKKSKNKLIEKLSYEHFEFNNIYYIKINAAYDPNKLLDLTEDELRQIILINKEYFFQSFNGFNWRQINERKYYRFVKKYNNKLQSYTEMM